MKPSARIVACLSACVIVGVAVWRVTPGLGADRKGSPSSSSVPSPTISTPKANADGVALERDHAAVFQRAFWRRPSPGDRILHAERRDWVDSSNRIEKWQWFIAVQPSAAFRNWFFKENPFELIAVTPDLQIAPLSSPPAWFPPSTDLTIFTGYRNHEGRYLVFYDPSNNTLFATDSGGGLATAQK